MTHPISHIIPAVFFPVKDLKQATEWYANLLERPIVPKEHEDGIYIFDLDGTEIILDSNSWGSPPMIMFGTEDIHAAHAFCKEHPHEIVTDVFSDEYISVFNINSHMVCRANRVLESPRAKHGHALLSRMSHVVIHTDELHEAVRWYEVFVGKKAEPNPRLGELPFIQMDRGAHLLIDDNQLCESSPVYFDAMKASLRVNPVVILESSDLTAALRHVRSKGAVATEITEKWSVRSFSFHDPDGNGIMVCEGKGKAEILLERYSS
jgi:catechol 2,3-dioxygenase-like lactoylglutathione lyase family enzyme